MVLLLIFNNRIIFKKEKGIVRSAVVSGGYAFLGPLMQRTCIFCGYSHRG